MAGQLDSLLKSVAKDIVSTLGNSLDATVTYTKKGVSSYNVETGEQITVDGILCTTASTLNCQWSSNCIELSHDFTGETNFESIVRTTNQQDVSILALNAAKTGVGIGVFSLEMSSGQLVTRLLCIESRVDAGRVR